MIEFGEAIAVPTGQHQETDPILAVKRWLSLAELTTGPSGAASTARGTLFRHASPPEG
jgi:hypothetical protein